MINHWHFQILYHASSKIQADDGVEIEQSAWYGLHRVYCDDDGKAFQYDHEPEVFVREDELGIDGVPATPEGAILKILQDMIKDAASAPIMKADAIPEEGAFAPVLMPGIFHKAD